MIQIQAINNILQANNIPEYMTNGINPEHFGEYSNEYLYIIDHYKTYDKVPDIETFLSKFSDFEIVDVLEPTNYIITGLKEEYLFEKGVDLFQQSAKKLEQNSYEGLQYIIEKAERLLAGDTLIKGVDINDNEYVTKKVEDIESKKGKDGLLGISSGMPEIDKYLHGWLPGEELTCIVGRINQGKSWLLQKFLTEAHKQGKTVLHYSGEMGIMQVSYRHDTLGLNYSNTSLMMGTINDTDLHQYKQDINNNTQELQPYIVITPKELGGKMLDITTLRLLIKRYKPDIVGIDQLSLMTDERGRNDPLRIQQGHITMDLFNLSTEFSIPVLADVQANRNKANMDNPENPDLEDISEADSIGQNSSRVISLVQTKMGLSLFIAKNRYGEKGKKLIYSWDIDLGQFRYVQEQQDGVDPPVMQPQLPLQNNKRNNNITDVF